MTMTEWHSRKYWQNRPVQERIKNARIPTRYEGKNLENYDVDCGDSVAHDAVSLWASKFNNNVSDGMGLLLYGPTGVGKTHLAQGALLDVVTNYNRSGIFISADRYVDMIYDEMRNDGELPEPYADPYLLKYMRRVFDVVVIDGLGDERAKTEFAKSSLIALIDNRYEEKLVTIITTMLSPKDIGRIYGSRTASMIEESMFFIFVEGSDYRVASKHARQ